MIDLFAPGAYCRAPGGNLERPDIQSPVVRWLAWSINPDNSGNGSELVWDHCRSLWAGAGLADFPWLHCHSIEDVGRLIDVGLRESSPAIGLNLEDVNTDFTSRGIPLSTLALVLERWPREIHMPTLAWVQNGQGWEALRRVVAALEIFPDEAEDARHPLECAQHAFEEGLENVTFLFKTKPPNAPEDYDLTICHSLYTADDITPSREAWELWISSEPCRKLRDMSSPWYAKPYSSGPPVGPDKLPRALYPPSAGKGTFSGDDVLAFKRAISRGGRLLPWSPSTWSPTYGDAFALGKGTAVASSGVRGFQKQEWPSDPAMQTGNLGDKTYQAIRRARVSDPESSHFGEPLLDHKAVTLLEAFAARISLGPVWTGGVSVLDHDLTHATDGLPLYPAFDDAFVEGREVIAPEPLLVFRVGTSNPGHAFYATGTSGLRYWFGHLLASPKVGQRFVKGQKVGVVGPNTIGGGPHVHVGVNVERIWGAGEELEHHTDYSHGAPTIGEQLASH